LKDLSAVPKAKGKAKEKATKTNKGNASSSSKKKQLEPVVKSRLNKLKLEADVVRLAGKWKGRVKTLNVEATQSLVAAAEFPELGKSPVCMF
jgi:hypothetical protein